MEVDTLVLAGTLDVDGDGRHIVPVYLRPATPAHIADKLERIEARPLTPRDERQLIRTGYSVSTPPA